MGYNSRRSFRPAPVTSLAKYRPISRIGLCCQGSKPDLRGVAAGSRDEQVLPMRESPALRDERLRRLITGEERLDPKLLQRDILGRPERCYGAKPTERLVFDSHL